MKKLIVDYIETHRIYTSNGRIVRYVSYRAIKRLETKQNDWEPCGEGEVTFGETRVHSVPNLANDGQPPLTTPHPPHPVDI